LLFRGKSQKTERRSPYRRRDGLLAKEGKKEKKEKKKKKKKEKKEMPLLLCHIIRLHIDLANCVPD